MRPKLSIAYPHTADTFATWIMSPLSSFQVILVSYKSIFNGPVRAWLLALDKEGTKMASKILMPSDSSYQIAAIFEVSESNIDLDAVLRFMPRTISNYNFELNITGSLSMEIYNADGSVHLVLDETVLDESDQEEYKEYEYIRVTVKQMSYGRVKLYDVDGWLADVYPRLSFTFRSYYDDTEYLTDYLSDDDMPVILKQLKERTPKIPEQLHDGIWLLVQRRSGTLPPVRRILRLGGHE